MSTLGWIAASGLAMTALALVGAVTLVLGEARLRRLLLPLVSFSAGTLLGGALFHMLPAALAGGAQPLHVFLWTSVGFVLFLALEQFLHWHHCHRASAACRQPLTYLVLVGDGLHNLLGGVGVAGVFLVDVRLGLMAWLAAAAHEVPQELGDFGVLVHGGWPKGRALAFNVLSGSTFLLGGLATYAVSTRVDVAFLVPLAAGNFVYIAATDLIPEVHKHSDQSRVLNFACVLAGLSLLFLLRLLLPETSS